MTARHAGLIALVCGLAFWSQLGAARLWDRDEPRNAGCAREMLERGDWVVPVFNGELRAHKPVLLYWAMMPAFRWFGDSEWAARFPSALAATVTVCVTYLLGRHLFGPSAAAWSALILATNLMFVVAARAATPDSLLICFTTLALATFAWAAIRPAANEATNAKSPPQDTSQPLGRWDGLHWPSWTAWLTVYGLMGVAILAKGPIGLVLPTAVIGMFLLIVTCGTQPAAVESAGAEARMRWMASIRHVGRWFAPRHFLATCWRMRPATALLAALAVSLPWYIWVGLRTGGEWLEGFLLVHNFERAVRPMEGHSGPIIYYPVAILIGFFPWSLFSIPIAREATQRLRLRDPRSLAIVFILCWIIVWVALFTLASTKLPSYVTPTYPALALIAGWFFSRWQCNLQVSGPRLLLTGMVLLAMVGVSVAAALPTVGELFVPGAVRFAWIAIIPTLAGIAAFVLIRRRKAQVAQWLFAAAALFTVWGVFAYAGPRVSRHQACEQLVRHVELTALPQSELVAYRFLEPSWVFYAGHPLELYSTGRRQELIDRLLSDPQTFLITTAADWESLKTEAALPHQVLEQVPYFLRPDRQLVLVGRPSTTLNGQTAQQKHPDLHRR